MKKRHFIEEIRVTQPHLRLTVDGAVCEYELEKISKCLANANNGQRETFNASPSGHGIHWPLIDKDLSIDGLLRVAPSSSKRAAS
jgi:hypothetical protein